MISLLQQRRSIRLYQDQPVEKEKVDKVIQAALLAPSSRGRKPWRFIVVDDPALLLKLSEVKAHGGSFVKDAPLAVVVIGNTDESDACVEDTAIALTLMQLQAERLNLGSCWVQLRMRMDDQSMDSEAKVRDLLNIPANYLVEALMTFGYKGEDKEPYSPEHLEIEKVHYNHFAIPYPLKLK